MITGKSAKGMFLYLHIYLSKKKLYLSPQSKSTNVNIKISNNAYHVTEQKI